jgi:hypothetical protein
MLKKDDEDLEFLILRSRLALGQVDAVLTATKSASNPTQKGIALLAQCLKAPTPGEAEQLFAGRDDTFSHTSPNYAVCLAVISLRSDEPSRALEVLQGVSTPEAVAVRIQALLALARVDLAEAELPNVTHC